MKHPVYYPWLVRENSYEKLMSCWNEMLGGTVKSDSFLIPRDHTSFVRFKHYKTVYNCLNLDVQDPKFCTYFEFKFYVYWFFMGNPCSSVNSLVVSPKINVLK